MAERPVLVAIKDHVAHVRLNRPDKRNAIDGSIMSGLEDAASEIAAAPEARAVVLSGEGASFCAGLDMANMDSMASGDLGANNESVSEAYENRSPAGANQAQRLGWQWRELAIPVIASVHGHALGGGLNLAMGADIRIMTPDVSLGFVEITWGLLPDMSGSQSLCRAVGEDRAKLLMMTGERFDGEAALNWGVATELADDPLKRATEIANTISGFNPDAIRAIKTLVEASHDLNTRDGLGLEGESSASLLGTANQMEAVIANLEGRQADYQV